MGIAGAALTHKVLRVNMWKTCQLYWDATDKNALRDAARMLRSLKTGVSQLFKYYKNEEVELPRDCQAHDGFPFKNSFLRVEAEKETRFKYVRRL